MKTTLSALLAALLYMALQFFCVPANAQSGDTPPNILMIIVDDLNDYVGFLKGHPQTRTPNMNAIARRSTVFLNAYCPSPACTPSRTSFMTGKTAYYTGIYSNSGPYVKKKAFRQALNETTGGGTIYTLPELLKDSGGYFTANFHKVYHGWSDQGFDNDFDAAGAPCSRSKSWNYFMDYGLSEDQFPDTTGSEPFFHGMSGLAMGPLKNNQEDSMNDSRMISRAIDFLENYSTDPGQYCDKPFFAAVGIFRPHLPFFLPERYFYEQYERDYNHFPYPIPYNEPADLWPPNGIVHAADPEFPGQDFDHLSPFAKDLAGGLYNTYQDFQEFPTKLENLPAIAPGLDSATRSEIISQSQQTLTLMAYLAGVRYADAQVGRLTQALENIPKLADNTIVVILGDNGYSLREHQHYHKFALWETDLRVPLLIYDPRQPGSSREVVQTVNLLDLFPTLLELAGVEAPMQADQPYADGISLVPQLNDPSTLVNRPVLSIARAPSAAPIPGSCFDQYSVRSIDWHYIRYQTDNDGDCDPAISETIEELYHIGVDREIDPHEWHNLAADTTYELVKNYLSQWLPTGPLFNQTTGSVVIKGAKCSSDLKLKAKHVGADSITNFQWHVNGHTYSGTNLNLTIDEPTVVALTADCGEYFLLDIVSLNHQPYDASFVPSIDGSVVEISTADNRESNWTYGDGFKINGPAVSHQYAAPGHYTITRKVGEGSCTAADTAFIYIDSAAFDGLCIPPQSMRPYRRGFNKAEIRWSPVYRADAYEFAFQPRFIGASGVWNSIIISDTTVEMFNLIPDQEYAFRVRSIYPDCTSEWSFEKAFLTKACDPPSRATITALTADAVTFEWTPAVHGELAYQQMGYLPPTGGPTIFNLPSTASSQTAADLTPGGTYTIRGRSVCNQYTGETGFSKLSPGVTFSLPTVKTTSSKTAEEGQTTSSLYDLYGRKLLDLAPEMIKGADRLENLLPDWLPAGLYLIDGQLVSKF